MNRLASVEPQYQGAGERLVIRIIRNDLAARDNLRHRIRINSALEHALESVAGKVQVLTVHSLSFPGPHRYDHVIFLIAKSGRSLSLVQRRMP
ncbi:MAG TPA: hypothetical protein VMV87_14935 [Burkholderiales bacterium]|nr:hypothetical protein [Burkholderiales bacterium]